MTIRSTITDPPTQKVPHTQRQIDHYIVVLEVFRKVTLRIREESGWNALHRVDEYGRLGKRQKEPYPT